MGIVVILSSFACLDKVLTLNSHYARLFYEMGVNCKDHCPLSKQEEYFRKAVFYDPNMRQAYYFLGEVYEKKGDRKKAFQSFLKALDRRSGRTYSKVGMYYFQKKEFELAVRHFWSADADVNYYIGKIFEMKGQYQSAEYHYMAAHNFDPQNARAYLRRGLIHYRFGHYIAAEEEVAALYALKKKYLGGPTERFN